MSWIRRLIRSYIRGARANTLPLWRRVQAKGTQVTEIPKAPKGYWTCSRCWAYGKWCRNRAFRPDSEEKIIDADGDPICQQCNKTYWRERAKVEAMEANNEL